jgi:hypothetical protein
LLFDWFRLLEIEFVADGEGTDGDLLQVEIAVHRSDPGDLGGLVLAVCGRCLDDGAIGFAEAGEDNLEALVGAGVGKAENGEGHCLRAAARSLTSSNYAR